MAETAIPGIFTLVFVVVLLSVGLIVAFRAVNKGEVISKEVAGVDIMVKFLEDGLIMTTTADLELEKIKIYLKRGGGEEEFEEILETETLKALDVYRYDFPYNDVGLVIVYYYDESYEGGARWMPYYLHNYEFEGEE